MALEAGWLDKVLRGILYQSLNATIKDHLCSQPETHTFKDLVSAALCSDVRLRERQVKRDRQARKQPSNTILHSTTLNSPLPPVLDSSHNSVKEPIQIGQSKLTPEERQKRKEESSCFYCGNHGHLVSHCHLRLKGRTPH